MLWRLYDKPLMSDEGVRFAIAIGIEILFVTVNDKNSWICALTINLF